MKVTSKELIDVVKSILELNPNVYALVNSIKYITMGMVSMKQMDLQFDHLILTVMQLEN